MKIKFKYLKSLKPSFYSLRQKIDKAYEEELQNLADKHKTPLQFDGIEWQILLDGDWVSSEEGHLLSIYNDLIELDKIASAMGAVPPDWDRYYPKTK